MNLTIKQRELLKKAKWEIVCESPFEIVHAEGSTACGIAAKYAISGILEDLEEEAAPVIKTKDPQYQFYKSGMFLYPQLNGVSFGAIEFRDEDLLDYVLKCCKDPGQNDDQFSVTIPRKLSDFIVNTTTKIADEDKHYLGHGDYEIIPALTAEEAQSKARKLFYALAEAGLTSHKSYSVKQDPPKNFDFVFRLGGDFKDPASLYEALKKACKVGHLEVWVSKSTMRLAETLPSYCRASSMVSFPSPAQCAPFYQWLPNEIVPSIRVIINPNLP